MESRLLNLDSMRKFALAKLDESLKADGRHLSSSDITFNFSNPKALSAVYVEEMSRFSYGTSSQQDVSMNFTRMNFNLLNDDDPAWRATDSLFVDFKQLTAQLRTAKEDVFELLQNFEQLCEDQIEILQRIMQRGAPGQLRYARTVEMLRLMRAERCTWRLIRLFYEDRLKKQPVELLPSANDDMDCQSNSLSDFEIWTRLQRTNKEFRETTLLLKWCELNASDFLEDDSSANLRLFADKTFLWENTLHRLSNRQKSLNTRPMVTRLDPDVVTREGKNLDDKDAVDDAHFIRFVFALIRAGQKNKAVDLCVHCGQSWRAALIQGSGPFHDPNLKAQDGELITDTVGLANRDLFKSRCWILCEKVDIPAVESAFFGCLCGHLFSMLRACKSWEDYVWAYAVATSEFQFDDSLRNFGRTLRPLPPSVSVQADFNLSGIFQDIEACENETVKSEIADPFHVLQKFVVLDETESAVQFLHSFISKEEEASKHIIRFMAHVVLIFKLCDLPFQEYFANGVLESYVKLLIDERRTELVATYVGLLPNDMQIAWYAKFLQDIDDSNERVRCLSLAEKAALDVPSICVRVVQEIRFNSDFAQDSSFVEDFDNVTDVVSAFKTGGTVTKAHLKLINSIKWLLFDVQLRGEALKEANAIARLFLVGTNLKAVKQLFDLMPSDSVNVATNVWIQCSSPDDSVGELNADQQNCVHEYLSISAYLDTLEAFSDWFEHFYRRKPEPPSYNDDDSATLSFAENAAREHRLKEYRTEQQRWQEGVRIFTERATKMLNDVLHFPGGGWLQDVVQIDDGDEERNEILRMLRSRYIPSIVHMLLSIYNSTEQFDEALRLSDVVVANEFQLFKEFSSEQLKRLASNLAQCSVSAMDNGFDFVGYAKSAS